MTTTWRRSAGPRWEYLAGKGATPQRVLWASTSTKNPAYTDTMYVEELIGADTVDTMPEETIKAYQDHGKPEPRLRVRCRRHVSCFDELREAGVDYKDLTDTLEREGVEKFAASSTSSWRAGGEASGACACLSRLQLRVGDRDQHADRQRSRRESLGVDREDTEVAAAVAVVTARGDVPGVGTEAVLDEFLVGGVAHVHQHVQPHEPPEQALVALVVLDREHELPIFCPPQTQRRR